MLKSKMKRYIAMCLFVMMLFNLTTVYADNNKIEEDTTVNLVNSKIDPELQKVMDEATDDELIPVWLWRESIDDKLVDQLMIKEKGMDPAVYEDEAKFNSRRLPQIEKAVEEELGYEKAHAVIVSDEVMTASNITLTDIVTNVQAGRTPIDEAVSEEFDDFVMAKRGIQKQLQVEYNQTFVNEHIKQFGEREIIYNGKFASIIIVEATKTEINYYAELEEVKDISFYEPIIVEPMLDVVTEQVGVFSDDGTGYDGYGWVAQKGDGVKIGIIEAASGKIDSNAEHLKNNPNLHYVETVRADGTVINGVVSAHAIAVTSIIVGKSVTFDDRTYKGIAPNATVYQMSVIDGCDVMICIEKLVELGVNVINYSGGNQDDESMCYTQYARAFDELLRDKNVVLVAAAGNPGLQMAQPAICLNSIAVGAVDTKELYHPIEPPYPIRYNSAYQEASYLPNKPDVVAPGKAICYVLYYNPKYPEDTVWSPNGNSFSAAIVTGIIAQMMSENSSLKGNPLSVKARALLGADHSKLDVTGDAVKGTGLRNKSGAGLIDARYALNRIISSTRISIDLNTNNESERYYFEAGTRVKAVMVFNKNNDAMITSQSDLDDLDFRLKKESGVYYSGSQSSVNNVEIIDTTINESGYYYFDVNPYRIVDSENKPDVAIAFRVFE